MAENKNYKKVLLLPILGLVASVSAGKCEPYSDKFCHEFDSKGNCLKCATRYYMDK